MPRRPDQGEPFEQERDAYARGVLHGETQAARSQEKQRRPPGRVAWPWIMLAAAVLAVAWMTLGRPLVSQNVEVNQGGARPPATVPAVTVTPPGASSEAVADPAGGGEGLQTSGVPGVGAATARDADGGAAAPGAVEPPAPANVSTTEPDSGDAPAPAEPDPLNELVGGVRDLVPTPAVTIDVGLGES